MLAKVGEAGVSPFRFEELLRMQMQLLKSSCAQEATAILELTSLDGHTNFY